MATTVETEGNTVDEAVQAALDELGIDRSNAKVEILEEKSKGFFGIRGSGKVKVRVSLINSATGGIEKAMSLIEGVMKHLNIEGTINLKEEGDSIKFNIAGEDLGLLIGKHGETLSALQTIANVVLKKAGIEKRLVVDAENYRQRRAESLTDMARRAAERVASTGRAVLLRPMNSYDRRMVHLALQDNQKVYTVSEGEEPRRQIRIMPKG